MSKLVSRIEKISRGSPAPMGFGAATRAAQTPAMALIGILSQNSLEEAKSLASLDADGALLTGIDSGEEIASIAEALGSTPWGVRADALDGETADGLVQKGCDFFLVNPESVTVEAAKDDRAAFILSIPIGANDGFLRTLEDLPISAAFTSLADNGPSRFSASSTWYPFEPCSTSSCSWRFQSASLPGNSKAFETWGSTRSW